ncbi:MAG: DUF4394 domain-containing protein [Bacteroidota bacterium]
MKKLSNQNRPGKRFLQAISPSKSILCFLLLIGAGFLSKAQVSIYKTSLSGVNESPVNASLGTGSATLTIDHVANTMRLQCNFSGLTGATTNSHIHAATAVAGVGTAGVATTTPTFAGFPSGVTSGSYDNTLDMTLASSYNPAYVTANGGTVAGAYAALKASITAGTAYLNIHSSFAPGGEIRGFWAPYVQTFVASLSGPNESPANTSPGFGTAILTIDHAANKMRLQCGFSGLIGNTTASHIHAPTDVAGVGNAGVATTTPTFAGFPLGVKSGTYDNTLDMTVSSSYNAAYITANGGTITSAFAALKAAIIAGKAYLNVHSSAFPGGEIRGFWQEACPSLLFAYNRTNKHLVSFSPINPGVLLSDIALTGLDPNENLTGIDYRPVDGQLYAIATNTVTNVGRVVTVNRTTGAVVSVGAATYTINAAPYYGLDFNPVPDRIRLISSDNTSRRFNPIDGSLSGTDTPPFYAAGDINAGDLIEITDVAYTNSFAGSTLTTLYAIDYQQDLLVRVGGANGVPSPNGGETTTIGNTGVMAARHGGFDIETGTNTAYAVLSVGGASGTSRLYTVNLQTGAVTLVGVIGGTTVAAPALYDGLAIVPCVPTVCVAPTSRIYVDASVAVSGSGSSWGCAMKELSAAITMANATPAIKSIWVADGIYKPTTGTSRTAVMAITRADLMILGGFAGGEANASDANPAVNVTVISGDIGAAGNASDNSYRLVNIGGSPVSASPLLIDGFTFENGNANGAGDNAVGAAILSNAIPAATPVKIDRCIFRNNNASGSGGAIYLTSSSPTFDRCRFATNTAGSAGGAVYSFQASPSFSNTVFLSNSAPNGGGYYSNYGGSVFSKTVFTGNSATYGGGVYQNRMEARYHNCVFNNNSSYQGGAIYEQNASWSHIVNSTFFRNSGVSYGGAIVLTGSNSHTTTINSIFWKNTHGGSDASPWADFVNYTGGSNAYHNNILQINTAVPADNGTTIVNNTRGTDPLFVNEASVLGGDATWATADDGLVLTNSSLAVNTGDNALATGPTDIIGNARIGCGIVDKGAYENQNCCTATLLETMVTGNLNFGGNSTNYFNSANGFVPAGCNNSGLGSTTVTITDPNSEFCYLDGANNDVVNFTNNTLTITDVASTGAGALNFTMTFQLTPGAVGAVSETSDNFPNGGMNASLVGNLLTITMPGFSGPGSYSASYSFTGCVPGIADPAITSAASKGVFNDRNAVTKVSASATPSIAAVAKEVAPAGTGIVSNPFSNDLQVRYMGTEKAGITVISNTGKTMYTAGTTKQGVTHIDASNWAAGMYEVVITTASGKRMNYRVVKF